MATDSQVDIFASLKFSAATLHNFYVLTLKFLAGLFATETSMTWRATRSQKIPRSWLLLQNSFHALKCFDFSAEKQTKPKTTLSISRLDAVVTWRIACFVANADDKKRAQITKQNEWMKH